MSRRLNIQEIAALLAESTGKNSTEIERFLKELVALMSEQIFVDKLVVVKGLGTFKIIPVEQRESVDVNTKARITIAGHAKLSFLPEKSLRDVVNKPFSFFDSIEIDEEAALAEMNGAAQKKEEAKEKPSEEPTLPELPDTDLAEANTNKKRGALRVIRFLSVVGLLFVVAVVGYLTSELLFPADKEVVAPPYREVKAAVVAPDSLAKEEAGMAEELPDVIATVKIQTGSRLTLLALEHYGHKAFWVYIYEYNKDVIKNPNNIPMGTEISIPNLTLYGVDSTDEASIEKALAREAVLLQK